MSDDKWKIYKDRRKNWRWARIAPNGKVVGASTESYKNHLDCLENARLNGFPGIKENVKPKEKV